VFQLFTLNLASRRITVNNFLLPRVKINATICQHEASFLRSLFFLSINFT